MDGHAMAVAAAIGLIAMSISGIETRNRSLEGTVPLTRLTRKAGPPGAGHG
jgi:hypothetical protein